MLIVSDAVSAPSGLARITRDLASRIHANLSDVYRVATAGYAACGSARFPWMQYNLEGMKDWVIPSLPEICNDHFQGERGIVWFIWDLARVSWFSQWREFPEMFNSCPDLALWLANANIEKWIYAPIDAESVGGKLSFPLAKAAVGFDRIIAYGRWAADVVFKAIGEREAGRVHLSFIPHGIDGEIFTEMPRSASRRMFFQRTGAGPLLGGKPEPIQKDELLIGIVGTNTPRKDWSIGIEAVAKIAQLRPVRLWIHTDVYERHWSIPTLLVDHRILDKAVVSTGVLSDEDLATAYSACDVTLGIGLGEGFGYPIFESMFCGTPCVHGDYGGAPEWMGGNTLLVPPDGHFYEGMYAFKRPVFNIDNWVDKVIEIAGKRTNRPGELEWKELWPHWEAYLRKAAQTNVPGE